MKERSIAWILVGCLLCLPGIAAAFSPSLYVDSAPNAYGSPDWPGWWDTAKQDVSDGSFVNMRTGTYPGTLFMDPYDEIVYSTGDLGKRLHWIYWIPGMSVDDLDDLFQVKWVIDWDGVSYTYDWNSYSLVVEDPNDYWVEPGSWEDYDADGDSSPDGAIGTFGFAWWASDDYADPMSTDGNPYNETDQADIDALRNIVFNYQTHATGFIRYRQSPTDNWVVQPLRVNVVPEPASLFLLGSGVMGFLIRRRKSSRL